MLLALIICHLSVYIAANPFHKYPFVFLLDVGNEELEKTNSQQIRVSVPGGSVALRYPATGDGDTISHVRVSGIDFGTDLKANIVDGGPGYKYVVLVFMGNPGVPFDAVVTVQTVVDIGFNRQNVGTVANGEANTYQSEEDANDSAEDLSDNTEVKNDAQSVTYLQKNNAELMQSSSNVYSYANNEGMAEYDNSNENSGEENDTVDDDNEDSDEEVNLDGEDKSDYEGVSNENDVHKQYIDNVDQDDPNVQVKGIDDDDDDDEDNDDDSDNNGDEEINSKEDRYSSNDYIHSPVIVESNLYSKYKALQDRLNIGAQVYSQNDVQKNSRPIYQEDPLDYEDPDAVGPVYDDEEMNNDVDKYRDSNNNNYIDLGDNYAEAYK